MEENRQRPVYYSIRVNCGCGFLKTLDSTVAQKMGPMLLGQLFKAAMEHITNTGHALDILGTLSPTESGGAIVEGRQSQPRGTGRIRE